MMDFVFCTDRNYLKGYGVLMLSILRFAPPPHKERLRFHVLGDGLDDAGKRALEAIAARRGGTEVAFYEPSRLLSAETLAIIDGTLQNRKSLSRATYYRILAADLLPPDVHRALYLDGDVLCTGGLEELFGIDMKGCPCGMCVDPYETRIWVYNRLGNPLSDAYFNAGVILLDLDLWRKESLAQAMLGYLAANAKRLAAHDQDLINACLRGRIFQLDFAYNLMPRAFFVFHWIRQEENGYLARSTQYLPKDEWPALLAGVESPRLVHGIKEWIGKSSHPFAPVWRCFYAQSPWAHERLNRLPVKARIRRLGRRALERLHLVSPVPTIPYPEEAYKVAQRVLDEAKRGFGDSATR